MLKKCLFNKELVGILPDTAPARGNFGIRARHTGFVAIQALFCRTRRGRGCTTQAFIFKRNQKPSATTENISVESS
jgi:hypothetical protein